MKNLTDLKELEPCENGYKFAKSKNSLIEAWETCERGDWMLWFAQKLDCPVELLTLAKAKCAATVQHLMHDKRSRQAIKIAIDFGNGVATREELSAASDAAYAAASAAFNDDAAAAYAYNAAYAAAAASDAAFNDDDAAFDDDDAAFDDDVYNATAAAFAAYAATNAAFAASDAAADASNAAARKENQALTANICRLILTDFIKSKL